jgi:hypothetical protein
MIATALVLDLLVATLPVVSADSGCPSAESIAAHLSTLLSPTNAQPGTASVATQLDELIIRLRPQGYDGAERRIAVRGGCEDRALAAAIAIATWWPVRPRPPAPEAPTTSPAVDGGHQPAAIVGGVAGGTGRSRSSATIAAGAFASMVPDTLAPGLRLAVNWQPWPGRLGLRLALAATDTHDTALAVGRVGWRRMAAEAGLGWTQGPLELDGVAVTSRLWAEGSGYLTNQQSSGFAFGVSAGARLGWSIGRTTVWVEARGVAWPQSQRIVVVDASTSARTAHDLPHAELQGGAGLSFRLF